jgi:hypothetical protein
MSKSSKTSTVSGFLKKPKKRRPGIHAKSGTSKSKKSKNYKKAYASQGK